jgi:hypothetical protein
VFTNVSVSSAGHPVSGETERAALETAQLLDKLVSEHDAVFLLMDSREARWLPTVLCAAHNKMCFTAAIGFDTFVAMRHGVATPDGPEGRNVGCYFCNDVVAPTNSTKVPSSPHYTRARAHTHTHTRARTHARTHTERERTHARCTQLLACTYWCPPLASSAALCPGPAN